MNREIRVVLPPHLRTLARVSGEVRVEVSGTVSAASVLEAVESRFPMLRGTIRDHATGRRRDFIRYFACGRDLSHDPAEASLPSEVGEGRESFLIVGSISGG